MALGAGAVIVGLMATFEFLRSGRTGAVDESTPSQLESPSWAESGSDANETPESSDLESLGLMLGERTGREVQFVDPKNGTGMTTLMLVGAPGLWPPETRRTNSQGVGRLPEVEVTTLRGRSVSTWEVLGRASDGSKAYWGTVEAEDFQTDGVPALQMEDASPIDVQIIGTDGEPVRGTQLRLSRASVGFVHVTKRGDEAGRATFRAVPDGSYLISAETDGGARGSYMLEHDGTTERSVTIRVEADESREVPDSRGDEGPMPEVAVDLQGLETSRWSDVRATWRREQGHWQPASLQEVGQGNRRWKRPLAPGSYTLRLQGAGGAEARREFQVADRDRQITWDVELTDRGASAELYVTDEWGGPVAGAWVQVWSGGRQVESATSRGSKPIELNIEPGRTYRIFAVTGRQGEGLEVIEAKDEAEGREWVVDLSDPLLTHSVPPGRVRQLDQLESILGQSVVEDGQALVVDAVDPESPAVEAGLKRGDQLLAVWQVGPAWRVVVERDGAIRKFKIPRP